MPGQRDDAAAGWGASGPLYAVGAYGIWGIVPIYWKWLSKVPALELVAPRIVWTALLLVVLLAISGRAREIAFGDRRLIRPVLVAALLVAFNWFIFIHAVQTDQVLATSLGYYINPLVSVALGRILLGEHLRRTQVVAVAVAAAGIAVVALRVGGIPWISLVLAGSFGTYGLLRKTTDVPPLSGSAFETLALLPFGLAFIAWLYARGESHFVTGAGLGTDLLMLATGPITAIPLLLFVNAARRLRLSTLGFLQYLAPSVQFVLAVSVFGEPTPPTRIAAFVLVWVALALFSVDAWRHRPRSR